MAVEQCIFNKNSGRGVINTVRIALGSVLSEPQERGQHPNFFLDREPTEVSSENPSVGDSAPPPKKHCHKKITYKYRAVRFINLPSQAIHFRPGHTKPTAVNYYVLYIVQDRGSLVGRCPRIFCVSRELSDDEKQAESFTTSEQQRHP